MDEGQSNARVAQFSTFATLGAIGTAQDLIARVLAGVDDAEPDLVAEETLCMVATATARAASAGLQAEKVISEAVIPYLLELPYTYRDYLVAGAILRDEDSSMLKDGQAVYARLESKLAFYAVQFPEGKYPSQHALVDKMELWMGRVSPPGLPESPGVRMKKLDLLTPLLTQVKLVLAFGKSGI